MTGTVRRPGAAFQCFFPSEVSIRESVAGERPLLAIDGKLGQRMISYLGAGVYEEVMFRLMLIPASLFVLTRAFKMPGKWAAVMSVFLASLAFSVAYSSARAEKRFRCSASHSARRPAASSEPSSCCEASASPSAVTPSMKTPGVMSACCCRENSPVRL